MFFVLDPYKPTIFGVLGLWTCASRASQKMHHELAHSPLIVLTNSRYVDETSIPASTLEAERAILTEQALASGKKPEFVDKMVEGRLKKFYAEVSVFQVHEE